MSWNPIPGQANVLSASIVAKADGSPIIVGTVNAYVIADTGANAGKWFKTSDNSWSATEAVSGVCAFKGGSIWDVSVDAECWTAGIEYTAYYVESGGLNVIGSPERYRCEYPQDLLRIGSVVQSLTDFLDLVDSGYDPATHTILANLRYLFGTILTETAGAGKLAAALSKLLDVETANLTAASKNQTGDAYGYASGTLLAAVQAIQNNTLTTIALSPSVIRPPAGVVRHIVYLNNFDEVGNMEEPDAAPTVAVMGAGAVDLSGYLQNPVTHADTTTMVKVSDGRYWIEFEVPSTATYLGGLTFTFTIIEGGLTRYQDRGSVLVDTEAVDFTSTDRTALQAIQAVTDELPDAGGLDDLAAILVIAVKLLKYQANKRTLSQAGLETVKADNASDPFASRTLTDKNNVPIAPGAGIPATATAFVEA
jgi:hypothetical protein